MSESHVQASNEHHRARNDNKRKHVEFKGASLLSQQINGKLMANSLHMKPPLLHSEKEVEELNASASLSFLHVIGSHYM